MDLISYYAKFGPKKPNGEASGKAARSSGVNKKIASQQATPVVSVDSAPPDDPFNDTVDSDVEEDDSKEIPPKELVKLMRLLRTPLSNEIRPFVIKFNETHRIVSFYFVNP
jgi:cobalamin biosynthesis protein CobT